MTTVAILFSGGLDSTAAAILQPDAKLIRVSVGSRYDTIERQQAQRVANALKREVIHVDGVVNLSRYERDDALVPARNAMLVLTAAQHTDGEIQLVSVQGDGTHATDKDVQFATIMSALIAKLFSDNRRVTVPFREGSKIELASRAMEFDAGLMFAAIPHVFSCYDGRSSVHCGRCKACVRLYAVLHYIDPFKSGQWPFFTMYPDEHSLDYLRDVYAGRGKEEAIALEIYKRLKK